MRELESRLKEILDQELSIYKKILEIARRKTEILKQSDLDLLEALMLEEREVVEQVGMLELEREKVIGGLAKELGVSERLDLSKMSDYFSQAGQAGFENIKESLSQVIEELRQVNSLNETLIRDSLEYIDFSLNIMTSASVDGAYGQNAVEMENREGLSKKSLFDSKA